MEAYELPETPSHPYGPTANGPALGRLSKSGCRPKTVPCLNFNHLAKCARVDQLPFFHILGDGKLNPIAGLNIPIRRIPIKGGMTIPKKRDFWPWHKL